jgi:hypothetical protein
MWLVVNGEYKEYEECYKKVEKEKKDIFLL